MKKILKKLIESGILFIVNIANRTAAGRYFFDQILNAVTNTTRSIRHRGFDLTLAAPNSLNYFRINTFSTKEPETLEWIDSFSQGSVVWDIGANVGLYTCYAAKSRDCNVFAFEPSVFNLELLARNIFLNSLTKKVTIIPLPLSDALMTSTLNMTTTEWGGALSTFGQDYGHDGQSLNKIFEFHTIGISMIDAIELLKIPQPDYIKLDVDGIEHLILKGGSAVIKNVKGVLIEINEDFERQTVDSAMYLRKAGLVLKEKRHAEIFNGTIFKSCYNQIWYRPYES